MWWRPPTPAPVARAALTMTHTQPVAPSRAPTLGEHTDAILGELGYSPTEIAALREQNAI